MALKAAVWTHGTIVHIENRVETVVRRGGGTEIRQWVGKNWFHFPITTPVVLDDVRPPLVKVFVFYKANFARITNVDVFDGPRRVKALDVNLSGDHSAGIDGSNSWVINPPLGIQFGLGLSVGVEPTNDPDKPGVPEIIFTTAGADFQKP